MTELDEEERIDSAPRREAQRMPPGDHGRTVHARFRLPRAVSRGALGPCELQALLGEDDHPCAWLQQCAGVTAVEADVALPYRLAVAPPAGHVFCTECFIDELARAAWRDPLQYRRELLPPDSPARRLLDEAARASRWSCTLPRGRARGLALLAAADVLVVQVAEVALESDGRPRLQSLTALSNGGTEARRSKAGLLAAAPAVANALTALTGRRPRRLPLLASAA